MAGRREMLCVLLALTFLGVDAANGDWKKSFPPWGETGLPTSGAPIVRFPIIGPLTRSSCYPSEMATLRIAVNHVNRRDSTLCPAIADLTENFEFRYDLFDTYSSGVGAASAVLRAMDMYQVRVVQGAWSSGSSKASSQVLSVFGIPQLSYSSTSSDLSNKVSYPQFFRSTCPDSDVMKIMAGMIAGLGYKEVNVLYFDADFQSGQARDFRVPAETIHGIKVNSFSLPNSGGGGANVNDENMVEIQTVLRAIRKKSCRVMIAFAINQEAYDLWKAADDLGMVRKPGWAWFGGDGISGGQFSGDPERVQIFQGTMYLMAEPKGPLFSDFEAKWAAEMPTTQWPEFDTQINCKDNTKCTDNPDFIGWVPGVHDTAMLCTAYAGPAYDAVVTLAIVADRLIKGSGGTPVDPDTLTAEDWLTEMRKLSEPGRTFSCLSGDVTYNAKQERDMSMTMYNYQPGWSGTVGAPEDTLGVPVGGWSALGGNQWIVGAEVMWPTGVVAEITNSSMPPLHPSGKPPLCATGLVFDSEADKCIPCDAGTRAAIIGGIPSCVPCAPGTYQNETQQASCKPCPAGTFSDETGMLQCKGCPSGSFQADVGGSGCVTCPTGTAQPKTGQSGCDRCPLGSFADSTNSTRCTPCPFAEHTTSFPGAIAASECGCEAGTYQSKADPERCLTCKLGMKCAFQADESGFDRLAQDSAADVIVPMVEPGYYTKADEPMSVYECRNEDYCPGGLPNTCGHGRSDIACATCPDDYHPAGAGCQKCSGGTKAMAVLFPAVIAIGMPLFVYYCANSRLTPGASVSLGLSIAGGIIVTSSQVLGMFSTLSVPWPEGFSGTMSAFSILMVKPEVLSIPCIIGSNAATIYATQVAYSYLVFLLFGVYLLLSKVIANAMQKPEKAWSLDKTLNSVGAVMQMLFIALVGQAAVPYQCFSHPNKKKSLTEYPNIVCGDSDQLPMVIVAIFVLLTIVIPFISINMMAVRDAGSPKEDQGQQTNPRLVRFRYLLYRFRPDVWWWGVAFQFRQTMLAFAPIVAPDDPHVQVVFITTVLLVYAIPQGIFWPWKTREHNLLDAFSTLFLIVIIVMVTSFTPASPASVGHEVALWVLISMLFAINIGFLAYSLVLLWFKGPTASFGSAYPRNKTLQELGEDVRSLGTLLERTKIDRITEALQMMNDYDRYSIDNAISVLQSYPLQEAQLRLITAKSVPRMVLPSSMGTEAGTTGEVAKQPSVATEPKVDIRDVLAKIESMETSSRHASNDILDRMGNLEQELSKTRGYMAQFSFDMVPMEELPETRPQAVRSDLHPAAFPGWTTEQAEIQEVMLDVE
eukprot:TRINITY_DN1758_c0_g1_i4.p1 TRINITY_DN1758_c0_g1~~TRINITY_DN1758_c0_g1_i4.p1  ORF type:complete len:1319 (+),score=213.72 TRINITY_DN1758_c0_g1_i4:48-4004(+)